MHISKKSSTFALEFETQPNNNAQNHGPQPLRGAKLLGIAFSMMQHEFEALVGVKVTAQEYAIIEDAYMSNDMCKQEFAALWRKMYAKRIQEYKKAQAEREAKINAFWALHRLQGIVLEKMHSKQEDATASEFLTARDLKTLESVGVETFNGRAAAWILNRRIYFKLEELKA